MPPEVQKRIFEPFFTTKAEGKGTGLGLSTVAGLVKHYDGLIELESVLGQGTEFKIYLPAQDNAAAEENQLPRPKPPMGHGELILIIDDEVGVRELASAALEGFAYRVVSAANGLQGISRFEEHQGEVRLLLCDTDMPLMNGTATIQAIQKIQPDIRVIIASGSQRDPEQMKGIDPPRLSILSKPYSLDQLLHAVDAALNDGKK